MNLDQHLPLASHSRLNNFSAIVERHQDLVWAIAFAATGDAATSDDVVQETFLAAWKQQADIRELAKMRGYLASIARNLAYRSLRGGGREVLDGGDRGQATVAEGPSPLECMLSDEKMTQVERGLLEMPRASREPFVLFYLEGSSLSRVAADLDLSESAVKQRLYRARESLKSSVASQLASEVARCRPALGAAIFTLIVSQISKATAAAGGAATAGVASAGVGIAPAASVAPSASLVSTAGVASSASASTASLAATTTAASHAQAAQSKVFETQLPGSEAHSSGSAVKTGLLGGGAIAFATKAGAVAAAIVLASTLYSLSGEAGASAPPLEVQTQEKVEAQDQVEANAVPRFEPSLEVSAPEEAPQVEGLSDQPLITGRLRLNYPGIDADEDGHISEEEVQEVRSSQAALVLSLIEKHWEDEGREVGCSAVGLDADGAYEGGEMYSITELRKQRAKDIREGLDLSLPEWIASQVATESREGRVCYKARVRFVDEVRQLKFEFGDKPIGWSVNSISKSGNRFYIETLPKQLTRELLKVANTEMAQAFCDRWGVSMSAYKNDTFVNLGASGYEAPATMHRHPAIEALAAQHDAELEAKLAAAESTDDSQAESL